MPRKAGATGSWLNPISLSQVNASWVYLGAKASVLRRLCRGVDFLVRQAAGHDRDWDAKAPGALYKDS